MQHDKDFESIEEHEHHHHVVPPRIYITVLLTLLVFTAATVGASYIDLGPLNPVIALAIAATKMILVVLFNGFEVFVVLHIVLRDYPALTKLGRGTQFNDG